MQGVSGMSTMYGPTAQREVGGGLQVVEQGQHHAWGGLTAEIGDVYV